MVNLDGLKPACEVKGGELTRRSFPAHFSIFWGGEASAPPFLISPVLALTASSSSISSINDYMQLPTKKFKNLSVLN